MTPSTRTPSKKQVEVLDALRLLQYEHGTAEPISFRTDDVLGMVRDVRHDDASLVNVINALTACVRHEWVALRTDGTNDPKAPRGANLLWAIQPAGIEAFRRAPREADNTTKENDVDTTTQDPPATGAPAWDAGNEPGPDQQGDDRAALDELDGEDGEEQSVGDDDVEVEEPKETRHTTEGQQLQFTLTIGGAKPTSSILSINAKQIAFVDREFKKGDVIPFHGEIRVTEVGARDKKKGTERFHKAVIDAVTIGVDG